MVVQLKPANATLDCNLSYKEVEFWVCLLAANTRSYSDAAVTNILAVRALRHTAPDEALYAGKSSTSFE